MTPPRLTVERTGAELVSALEVADGFWSRLKGLQFRRALPPGAGLLLVPCGSVHTHWMRFPIDAVMLDAAGRVLAVRRGVRPWRVVAAPTTTHAVLELATGGADGVEPGDAFRLAAPDARKSLKFLASQDP